MLEELLKELAGEFPLMKEIFVEERDMYMTNTLHTLLRRSTLDKRIAWSRMNGMFYCFYTVFPCLGNITMNQTLASFNSHFNFLLLMLSFIFEFSVPWQPVTVVAVVGIGHVPGIVANWNQQISVADLLTYFFPLYDIFTTYSL